MLRNSVKLRPAQNLDCRMLWRWRNEPSGLRNYFNPKPVTWAIHQRWFLEKQVNPKSHLFVLEDGKKPVGLVRLEIMGRGVGEVHILLDKKARGKGFGPAGILAVTNKFFKNGAAQSIVAHIKPQNLPSVLAFLKAGFFFKKLIKIKGTTCYQLAKVKR